MFKETLFFIFWFYLFTIASNKVIAQTTISKNEGEKIDSLWNIYKNLKKIDAEDTTQINKLLDISFFYVQTKNDSSRILAEIVIQKAEEELYFEGTAKAVRIIGLYHRHKSNYDSAIHFFRASSDVFQEIGDSINSPLVLNELAGVYFLQGNYTRALENLLVALEIQRKKDNTLKVAHYLNNMALIYKRNNQYEKAIQMHKQSISMKERLKDSMGIATSYLNIGTVYLQQKKYKESIKYLEKGLPLVNTLNKQSLIGKYYTYLGISIIKFDSLKLYENRVREFFEKAENAQQKIDDKYLLFFIYLGKSEYYYHYTNSKNAELLAKKAIKLAQEMGLRKEIADSYRLIAAIYKKQSHFELSTEYLEKYTILDDSIKNEQNLNETKRLQAVFESERQEQIISALIEQKKLHKSEIARKEIWNYSLATGTVLFLIIAILIFIQKRNRDNQNAQILEKSTEISQQKEEITQQNIQLKETFSRLSILSEIGRKITATMDEDALISIIKESIEPIMPVDGFGIGIYNPHSQAIEYNNFIEKNNVLPFHTESVTEETKSLSVQSFMEDKEFFIVDVRKDYFQKNKRHVSPIIGEVPQTAFFIPLRIREHPIGVMTIQSFEKNPYTEDNLSLLRSLATYVSIAVANANAYKLIRDKNQNILDSLRYAKTIQNVLTPTQKVILNHFSEYCLIYGAKDIVSGDFYWLTKTNEYIFIAVVDCTGHGIPGAFMSMIGNMLLEESINREKHIQPSKILQLMHERIRKLLKQDIKTKEKNSSRSNKDGMDIVLCRIEQKTSRMYEVTYSGAKRPLWYAEPTHKEIQEIGATRSSIGGKQRETIRLFEEDIIWLPTGSSLYLTTDGFADQNSPQAERIGSHNLKLFLNTILHKDMATQQDLLIDYLEEHRQGAEQRDDITFWGVKLS